MWGLAQEIGSNRISRDLQKQLLVILSELEHRELGHDGAVFFATESGGGVAAL